MIKRLEAGGLEAFGEVWVDPEGGWLMALGDRSEPYLSTSARPWRLYKDGELIALGMGTPKATLAAPGAPKQWVQGNWTACEEAKPFAERAMTAFSARMTEDLQRRHAEVVAAAAGRAAAARRVLGLDRGTDDA